MTYKGKILVVDATLDSLRLLTDILTDEGYEVYYEINGELALRAAASNPPELVLLDVHMHGMDGYEVCRRLKDDPATRDVPVIFVSATSETAEKVKGFEMGAVDFVTKPYQRDELLARVRTHMELNHLHNHLGLVEARITRLTKLYRVLSEVNQAIVRMDDESALFPLVCRMMVDFGSARLAWIGQLNEAKGLIEPVVSFGCGVEYLDGLVISSKQDVPEGCGPSAIAYREDRNVIVNDFLTSEMTKPWHERARIYSWGSGGFFSLPRADKPFAVLAVYHSSPGAFDAEMTGIMAEMSCGISFALDNFDRENERRQAQETLNRSESRFRAYFEHSMVGMAATSPEKGWLEVNNAMCAMLGYSREELMRLTWAELTHPDDLAANEILFNRVVSGEIDEYTMDKRFMRKDDSLVYIHVASRAVRRPNGNLDYIVALVEDVTERKQQEVEIIAAKECLSTLIEAIPDAVFLKDGEGRWLVTNEPAKQMFQLHNLPWQGKTEMELADMQPASRAAREGCRTSDEKAWQTGRLLVGEERLTGEDGRCTIIETRKMPQFGKEGQRKGLVIIGRDITEQKQSDMALQLYGRALDASTNAIMIVDATKPEYPIIYVNPAFTDITGYSAEEALGQNPRFLHGSDRDQPEIENIRSAVREKRNGQAVLRNYRKDGSLFWNELCVSQVWNDSGEATHFIGVGRDITKRRGYEAELERMTNFDTLTGLPNRNLFYDRLSQAVVHAERNSGIMAVVVLNLDRFKLINDSLGHHAGDLLLQEVAHRLSDWARAEDTVARLSGDEFVITMPELAKAEDAVAIAEKLLLAFSMFMHCDIQKMYITASIGIAIYPKDGTDADSLLKHADLAMHRAKEQGRNHYQFYASEMNQHATEYLSIRNDLHLALERCEFTLHYQPQVDLKTGCIIGVEALLRWQHPVSGWISPADFIPIAEACGLILPIGTWVLQQACLTAKAWHDQGFKIVMAVNLSARQLREHGFVNVVQNALHTAGLEARYLELELTEGILIEQAEFVFEVFRQLRKIGVELSLDDFGTGYSSLSYLKRFPISRLKIDQSFIRDIVNDPEDAAIVGAIISMARNLKLKVIAEGVETAEQLAFLRQRHCDEIQGYYFSKPLPDGDITALLQQGKRLESADNSYEQAPFLLLLDDEENILNALFRVLRRDGYRILRTTSAQEALDMLASNEVGVIVSDQRMPEMNGVEFLRRAKQLHPNSMRIVLSGYTDLQTVTDAINEGAVYKFLTKPWDDEQLCDQIHEAFQRFEMKKERDALVIQLATANDELSRAKKLLEKRVDDKTLESLRNMDFLKVSQEVLECLPTGVVGVDEDGLIVVANKKAQEMLGVAATIGSFSAESLPPVMNELVQQTLRKGLDGCEDWKNPQGVEFTCCSRRMGASSQAQGVILVIASNGVQPG